MAKMITLVPKDNNITVIKFGNKICGQVENKNNLFYCFLKGSEKATDVKHTLNDAAQSVYRFSKTPSKPLNKELLMPILNNANLRDSLEILKVRWNEEKDFEDWADYAKHIVQLFEELDVKVLKTFKRQFAAVVQIPNMDPIKIFLKQKSNCVCLATKAV